MPGRTFQQTWDDPRTGSELAWVRIVAGLRALGHTVDPVWDREWSECDVSIAINDPRTLRTATGLRICEFFLNEFSFCNNEPFDEYVQIYLSPSEAHRQKAIGDWGAPKPEKWFTNYLGCDARGHADAGVVNQSANEGRVPGRCVYCSSPDRGLHRVLEAWPAIRRAAPTATLKIFYRLAPWLRQFDTTPYYPPIERNRGRALYIEEALARLSDPKWGVTVLDSVSHEEVLREMAQAEVLLHPCDPLAWSEGFSCTVVDACSMGAVPVITDADALGEVYRELDPVRLGQWEHWRHRVIEALTNPNELKHYQEKARVLAEELTWANHVKRLDEVIRGRIEG